MLESDGGGGCSRRSADSRTVFAGLSSRSGWWPSCLASRPSRGCITSSRAGASPTPARRSAGARPHAGPLAHRPRRDRHRLHQSHARRARSTLSACRGAVARRHHAGHSARPAGGAHLRLERRQDAAVDRRQGVARRPRLQQPDRAGPAAGRPHPGEAAPRPPARLHHRRPGRLSGARDGLGERPAQGRDLRPAVRPDRAHPRLRQRRGGRPAGDRRRPGGDRHAGRALPAGAALQPVDLHHERGLAARPGGGYRLLAVHRRTLSRGARPRRRRGPGDRDDRGARRARHLLQRHRRDGRPVGPAHVLLHVTALDRRGRRHRRGLLGTVGPHPAAGRAGRAGPPGRRPAPVRPARRREPLLAGLVELGHGPPRRGAGRHHRRDRRLRRPDRAHQDQRAHRHFAAHQPAGAPGLRHPAGALRPRGAEPGRGAGHLERRGRGGAADRAAEPGRAVRLRPAPGGAARRSRRHEHRQPAGPRPRPANAGGFWAAVGEPSGRARRLPPGASPPHARARASPPPKPCWPRPPRPTPSCSRSRRAPTRVAARPRRSRRRSGASPRRPATRRTSPACRPARTTSSRPSTGAFPGSSSSWSA